MVYPPRYYQGRTADRHIQHWITVAVTALPPGWRNRFRDDDGSIHSSDCPALLVQEHRMTTYCWDEPPRGEHTEDEREQPPYATRVVFADNDAGELTAAKEIDNYIGTVGPGEVTDHGEPGAVNPIPGRDEQAVGPGWRRETTTTTVPTEALRGRFGAYGRTAATEWAQQVAEHDGWQDFQVSSEGEVFTVTFVRQVATSEQETQP